MPGYDILDTLTEEEKEMYYKRFAADLELQPNGVCLLLKRKSSSTRVKGAAVTILRYMSWYHQISIPEKSQYRPTCQSQECLAKEHMYFFKYPDTKAALASYLHQRAVPKDQCLVIEDIFLCSAGYARIYYHGKNEGLHRLAFWCGQEKYEKISDLPKDMVVAHLCRNKTCIKPEHYSLATFSENSGEHRVRDETNLCGEKHPQALIDQDLAQKIANSWAWTPKLSASKRAEHFNVTQHIVADIDRRKTWHMINHPNRKPIKLQRPSYTQAKVDFDVGESEREAIRQKLRQNSVDVQSKILETQCWVWTQSIHQRPVMSFRGQRRAAARFAAMVSSGRHLHNFFALHSCGNKDCVRPEHIRWGTPSENNQDTIIHGTASKKFTIKDIHFIRNSNQTITELTERFKVSRTCILDILKRRSWINV